jgi:hypothetical protein
LEQLLLKRKTFYLAVLSIRYYEECNDYDCCSTDWQVNVEAPSPRCLIGKDPAKKRSDDRGVPKVAPKKPAKIGRRCSGTVCNITIILPEKMPADPRPAMDLPMIKDIEFGAAPYMADSTSNIPMQPRKTHFVE